MTGLSNPPLWHPAHLKKFKTSLKEDLDPDEEGGSPWGSFSSGLSSSVFSKVTTSRLNEGRIERRAVFELAKAKNSVDTLTVCAAAMAWGGMRQNLAKTFFDKADDGWLDIAEQVRRGDLDRKTAYGRFEALRRADGKKLFGAGPAYYTKLIYFLSPRSEGAKDHAYIMDQWAACSVNLLTNDELVKMDVTRTWKHEQKEPGYSYRVSDANSSAHYEIFCRYIDALRKECDGLDPEKMDRALVARGGHNKSKWRKYVIMKRRTKDRRI